MKKTSVGIILSAGFLMFICILQISNVKAEDNADQGIGNIAVTQSGNQVINDEGYGNSDAEYYNSEDDMVNAEEPSGTQENSESKSIGNDAQ